MCSQDGRGHARPGVNAAGCSCTGLTCGCGCLVTKEPGLAAWDGLEVRVLRGLRHGLGSGGQECIEVLQPRDLGHRKRCNSCSWTEKVR